MNPLRDIFELALHYERGYWEEMGSAAVHPGVSEDAAPALYLESVDSTQQILSRRGQEQLKSA